MWIWGEYFIAQTALIEYKGVYRRFKKPPERRKANCDQY